MNLNENKEKIYQMICDDLYVINSGKTYLTKDIEDLETLGYARVTERKTVGNT